MLKIKLKIDILRLVFNKKVSKMRKLFLMIVCIFMMFTLNACSTKYKPYGRFTGGYSEMQMSDNIYQVYFSGNGYTSRSTVETYLLRRCAELTMEKNYEYFIIKSSSSNVFSSTTGGNSCSTSGTYNSYSYNSQTKCSQLAQINKYLNSATIKMFKKQNETDDLLNAKLILKQLER